MRYEDWDVLLFPCESGDAGHVPLQEFRTTCHLVKSSVVVVPRGEVQGEQSSATHGRRACYQDGRERDDVLTTYRGSDCGAHCHLFCAGVRCKRGLSGLYSFLDEARFSVQVDADAGWSAAGVGAQDDRRWAAHVVSVESVDARSIAPNGTD